MEIHFAPLQGYTDHLYRRFHAKVYDAPYAYYTPFIRVEKNAPRHQDITRLINSVGDGTNLIPQIIFNSFDEFRTLTEAIKDVGFRNIDLNLGCPFPMQTNKGRGAAMIANLQAMEKVSDYINADSASYSIKMRIGQKANDEWRSLMPILNDTKLSHITVHPRIAKQLYGGELFREEFNAILEESKNPILWNGDISTVNGINSTLHEFPKIKGIMIGRGLLARPSMVEEWRRADDYDHDTRLEKLLTFHQLLFDAYKETLCGQAQVLQKIKPFWDYLESEIGHKTAKLIHKSTTLTKYQSAIDRLYNTV